MLGTVGLRLALGFRATFVTTTAVFGSCLRSGLCSPLYSYSFTLCPSGYYRSILIQITQKQHRDKFPISVNQPQQTPKKWIFLNH